MTQELGRFPTASEIARELGRPLSEIRLLTQVDRDIMSLNRPVGSGDAAMGEFVMSKTVPPASPVLAQELTDLIRDILRELDERSRFIVECRFGLFGRESMTLEELGTVVGVTRERIRQLESKAIKKIGDGESRERLVDWLGNVDEEIDDESSSESNDGKETS